MLKINIPKDRGTLYEVIKYPAGEIQTRLTEAGLAAAKEAHWYEIIANPIPDIIELAQLANALNGVKHFYRKELYLPYLPYGRADRRFVPGDCNGLQVFATLIDSMGFDQIWSFDIHNPQVTTELFFTPIINIRPDRMCNQIFPCIQRIKEEGKLNLKEIALIIPDRGAIKRYDWDRHGLTALQCDKHRDPATGNLDGFIVPPMVSEFKAALIVDDICDGGGTFIGLGNEIRKLNPTIILGLYVSHGIFSKGLHPLYKVFDHVYNSDYTFKSSYVDEGEHFE